MQDDGQLKISFSLNRLNHFHKWRPIYHSCVFTVNRPSSNVFFFFFFFLFNLSRLVEARMSYFE